MQDNVKRPSTVTALLAAAITVIIMLVPFLISTREQDKIYYVPEATASNVSFTEKNGVRYIGDEFAVVNYTETVVRGKKASVTVHTENSAIVDIKVYYKSGRSQSTAFSPKITIDGIAFWEWTVPKSSTSDKMRIVLRTETTMATFDIYIV
jgi:hypothetical protein